MKHILGSCVLAGLFLFCACDDTLDTKVTWQIGDSDTWRVPELAQGVLYKAYNGIANRPDCFEDNFLDCATDNAVTNLRSSSVYKLNMGGMTAFNNPIGNWSNAYNMLNYVNSFLENGLTDQVQYNRTDPEVDKQIKLRLEGESYFLRAWWHFELLKMYGGKAKNGKRWVFRWQIILFRRMRPRRMVNFFVLLIRQQSILSLTIWIMPSSYYRMCIREMTWSLVIHKSVVPRKRRQLF